MMRLRVGRDAPELWGRVQPGVRDEFRLDGGFVRFERSDAAEVVAFEWSTRRVAGLRFERRP